MNLLTLKTIAYNPVDDTLYSPSHTGFAWSKGIIARACHRCDTDAFNPDCTCGVYGSPNVEALKEYAKYVNSIHVVMNTYGWVDIWSAPRDILGGGGLITRAWGTQIVGVVHVDAHTNPQRAITMLRAAELFEVPVWPLVMVKALIQASWKRIEGLVVKDPYDAETIRKWS